VRGSVILADVGGTWTRVGSTHDPRRAPIFVERTPGHVDAALEVLGRGVAKAFAAEPSARQVIIGVGGLVRRDGCVAASIYTPFSSINLKTFVEGEVGLAVRVENDVTLHYRGLPITPRLSLLISAGTGVGGAAGAVGRPLPDQSGYGGEFGHAYFGYGDEQCPCGRQGCIDLRLSGRRIAARLGAGWFESLTAPAVAHDLALSGYYFESVLTSLLRAYDPSAVFFAGSVFQTPQLRDSISRSAERHWSKLRMLFVRDNWAVGLKAATRLACEQTEERSNPWSVQFPNSAPLWPGDRHL